MPVVSAVVLFVVQWCAVIYYVLALFGEQTSRDDYISAGIGCITTLPVFGAMIVCAWQYGSRRGLWLIGVLATLMTLFGHMLLSNDGSYRELDPSRAPGLADVFGMSTWINWVAFAVFARLVVRNHRRQ